MATHTSMLAEELHEQRVSLVHGVAKSQKRLGMHGLTIYFRFLYYSVNRHFDCFHVLVIVNCAAINIGMNAPFQIIISFRYIPRVGFLDHMVALLLIFIRKFHNVCTVVVVIVAVHLLSPVRLFMTSWTAAHKASLSFTICQSLLKFMSIESMMPSDHFILFIPFSSCPQSFCSIRVFSYESALPIRWPKYWSFSFSFRLSSEY